MHTSVIIMYSYWVNQQWWTILIATETPIRYTEYGGSTFQGFWLYTNICIQDQTSVLIIVDGHVSVTPIDRGSTVPLLLLCESGTKLVEGVLLECGQSLISTFVIPSGSQQQLGLSSPPPAKKPRRDILPQIPGTLVLYNRYTWTLMYKDYVLRIIVCLLARRNYIFVVCVKQKNTKCILQRIIITFLYTWFHSTAS